LEVNFLLLWNTYSKRWKNKRCDIVRRVSGEGSGTKHGGAVVRGGRPIAGASIIVGVVVAG